MDLFLEGSTSAVQLFFQHATCSLLLLGQMGLFFISSTWSCVECNSLSIVVTDWLELVTSFVMSGIYLPTSSCCFRKTDVFILILTLRECSSYFLAVLLKHRHGVANERVAQCRGQNDALGGILQQEVMSQLYFCFLGVFCHNF